MDQSYIEELTWSEAREALYPLDPALCGIIDDLNPGKNLTLFKAKYFYGDEIIKKGLLHVPISDKLLPLNHDDIPSNIREKLDYNLCTNPVSIVLNNTAEIFMLLGNHTIPLYGLVPPGKIFSTSRILSSDTPFSPPFLWDMTAGARSIFMLPRISDYIGHERITREFKIEISPPKNLLDHWELFKKVVRSDQVKTSWHTELLFFTKQWFDHLDDPAWRAFKLYLLQSAWDGSEFWRNQFVWDLVFCVVQENRNLKPNPYIADTAKHILSTSVGATPGFAPAIDDKAAPCSELEKIYTDIYQIKEYQPIIMHPHSFSLKENRPVYYSLEYPSTMEFSPKSKRTSNKITDLREIKHILDKYFSEIFDGSLNVEGTPFQGLVDSVKFDYFHSNVQAYEGIQETTLMPEEDKHMNVSYPGAIKKKFPSNSPFARGSIRIKKKS